RTINIKRIDVFDSRKSSIFLINYIPVKPNCDDLLKTPASAHTNYLIIYFKERADLLAYLVS
ncbi:hypothetical protein, partial [Marinomonas pollencensis]